MDEERLKRHDLTDEEWERLEPLLPSTRPQRGGRWSDHRTVINGIFFRTRAGTTWRDLPPIYGNWKTVYNRHRRWSLDGTWTQIRPHLAPRSGHMIHLYSSLFIELSRLDRCH